MPQMTIDLKALVKKNWKGKIVKREDALQDQQALLSKIDDSVYQPVEEVDVTPVLSRNERLRLQAEAENAEIIVGNADNIRQMLPYLLEHQIEDVLKAEERLLVQDEKGILFTNSTGTGKTVLFAGIAKRFIKLRPDATILIVVPTDKKCKDWIIECSYLKIDVYQISDTKDSGRKVNVTTYANFRDNKSLQIREWDLVCYDESHKIMQNGKGEETNALLAHRRTTNYKDGLDRRAEYNILGKKPSPDNPVACTEYKKQLQGCSKEIYEETKRLLSKTKVVFLSATPFAYVTNLEYADGYLFDIGDTEQFLCENFSYTVDQNGRLMQPETGVDVGVLERDFADRLIKSGAMSTRRIKIPFDYSREFVLMDDTLGFQIDEGYMKLSDTKQFPNLSQVVNVKFDYLYVSQLLECIKARQSVARIKQHLALGRKVVVFHSYNHSLPTHPFMISRELFKKYPNCNAIMREISVFHQLNPTYQKLNISQLKNPIDTMKDAFGDNVVFFNGEINKKKRSEDLDWFNADHGPNVIVVQVEAGKEGISLHDKTGRKQRVSIMLGLPIAPTTAIQLEGRTYREGNKSDAPFEYPVLHTAFEKFAFASKISKRVRTAENLALGSQARNLEITFKEGYLNPISEPPHSGQGKGGKFGDTIYEIPDEFEKAKTYFAKRKIGKGKYIPEPLGYKLVEWLDYNTNEDILIPYANIGTIGRFLAPLTNNDLMEQDIRLRSQLAMNLSGFKNLMDSDLFELKINNKYQGIITDTGDMDAFERFGKSLMHLKNKGRLITILPEYEYGRYQDWLNGLGSSNYITRSEIHLPEFVLNRKAVIIVTDRINEKELAILADRKDYEFRDKIDFQEFFEAVKEVKLPVRAVSNVEKEKLLVNY